MSNFKLRPAVIAYEPVTAVTGVTIDTALGASDTTVSVDDSSSLPDRGIIQIDSEEILYMENDTANNDLKSCLRGFRGTTAATHTSGATVTHLFDILGKTNGGITFNVSESSQTLNSDQDGDTPIDEVITGTQATVEANLAEITLENLARVHGTTVKGSAGSQRVEIAPNVGYSLLTNAKKMLLIPYVGTTVSNDVEDLVTLPSAGLKSAETLTYDASTQQVIKVNFVGYPDSSNNIAVFGKEA